MIPVSSELLRAVTEPYRDYFQTTEVFHIPPGKVLGSRVTWKCHNPEPADVVRVQTSPDRITWVDVTENGGPAPLRLRDTKVWARAWVRRLATCPEPVMDLHVSIDIDTAEVDL